MVKALRPIPPAVRNAQARASNPAASAFVSANAGSGKTHVLVQRVIRLLLDDVPPQKILCITFTKAAAANMAERVFTTLGHWVTLDDDALDAAIQEAGIAHVGPQLRKSARKLFAAALETPGVWYGLIVDGIHVAPPMLRLALRGRGQPLLVTDAMPPVGGSQAEFRLQGQLVRLHDGRLTNAEGRLAGSSAAS